MVSESSRRLGQRLRALRKARRLSQSQLARAIGRNICTVRAVERGTRGVSVACAVDLAAALGTDVARLLSPPSRAALRCASGMYALPLSTTQSKQGVSHG